MYDFSKLKNKSKDIKEWLRGEYSGIRTGRATPAILDKIKVDAYGNKMPLNQVATITVEDSKSLKINTWDESLQKAVEGALRQNDMGLSVVADSAGIRVKFPDLTHERRETLNKVVRQKREEARVSLRTEREEIWDDIQKKEKSGDISEDEKFRFKDEMQRLVEEFGKELDDMTVNKEREILED